MTDNVRQVQPAAILADLANGMAVLSTEPEQSPTPPVGSDRRRAPRFKRNSKAQLIFWPSTTRTAPIDVQLIDYSSTGVGVMHSEQVLVGQKFVLREPFVTHDSSCLYTVVRCQKRDDGHFIIGLHAIAPDEVPQAPEPESDVAAIAYLIFALIGAVAIVAMAVFNR